MELIKQDLKDFCRLRLNLREDDRGFFTRVFCSRELVELGLVIRNVNESYSKNAYTFRGFHCQISPFQETKLIRCLSGSLLNVVVDLRVDSPTFGRYLETSLKSGDSFVNMIPPGFGNSVLTLEENTRMIYLTDNFYSVEHEICLSYNSYFFPQNLRKKIREVSKKDKNSVVISSLEELRGLMKDVTFCNGQEK